MSLKRGFFGTYLLFQYYVLPPEVGKWMAYCVAFSAAYNALTSQGPVKIIKTHSNNE